MRKNDGWFSLDRSVFESDIWEKPHYYFKIWVWIIGRANWKTVTKGGKIYYRGQFKTSYKEIIEENYWMVGYRPEKLKKDQIYRVLDFLMKTGRIQKPKTTRGLWITIKNYERYQKKTGGEDDNQIHTNHTEKRQGKEKQSKQIKKDNDIECVSEETHSETSLLKKEKKYLDSVRYKLLIESGMYKETAQKISSNAEFWEYKETDVNRALNNPKVKNTPAYIVRIYENYAENEW